ncbi:T9SS type B sorting domain-containing protein [Maribacter antarcticus]|uniref:T9SS type B sorting domain-containing protein n=1 Tax=Maribacter antarcticus TaxID=505250 RepID=UPI000685C227|nr:gliding motility-associated C-terminal domain-containing protein [Maribacter antarcticus]
MKNYSKIYILTTLLLLCAIVQLSAQAIVVNAPAPADNPNLAGNSPWPAICAGNGGFNEYFVNISWAGTTNTGNEFILELSDAAGNFAAPTTLSTITNKNSNNDFDVSFAVPLTTRGQGYRMRVRSTNPVRIGTESDAYNMYYMDVTSNLNISEAGDGVPPGSICSTNPITLQVDNITSPETYQYSWYRSGTLLAGEIGPTLNVTQSGMYSVFIDYGPICTGSGNSDSNIVDVTIGAGGSGITISSPSNTALCAGDTETLAIAITDSSWSYQWYKNDVVIPGAIGTTYTVNAATAGFEADYAVEISAPGVCTERSDAISITNADNYTVTRDTPANVVILPSQTQTLTVSTTANAPTYKWFRNTIEIAGETNSTLTITQEGDYYAEVTQSGGACVSSSKNSETTVAVSPASFELITNYASAYTSCVRTNMVLQVQTINAIAADGTSTDVTADLVDAFTYQWQWNGADVAGQSGKSISLVSNTENGDYLLIATLASYNESSNTLPVQLLTSETVTITSTSTIYCSVGDTVTVSTTADLISASYEWQKDGVAIAVTQETLTISAPGTYRLVLQRDGCPLISNEITIAPLDENLITLDPVGDVVIPEGTSRTVRASGGTAYRWINVSNVEMSTSDSVTFTKPGTYTLVASIDNCEVVRQVTVSVLDTFKVPNVITVNGDGINDQWIIPNVYSNKADINVIIYNEQGAEILNESNYNNNWPQSSTSFQKQNMVFYYKIRNPNEVLKQGTITVIR